MSKQNSYFAIAAVAVLGLALGGSQFTNKRAGPAALKRAPTPVKLAKPHLDTAEEKCEAVIDEHVKSIDQFFAASKLRTRDFATVSLGWGSKWRLLLDKLPGKSDRHGKYIKQQFDRYVFSKEDLTKEINDLVAGILLDVTSIEIDMLEDLHAEATDFSDAYRVASYDKEFLHQRYEELLTQFDNRVTVALPGRIRKDAVRVIATQLISQVAVHLATSSGILALSGGSGAVTGGIGIVVGLIVERLVSIVHDWWVNPIGRMEERLNAELDLVASTLKAELRNYLSTRLQQRSEIRTKTVLTMLQPAH